MSPEVQEVVERLEDLADKVEQDEARRDEEYRLAEEERDRRFEEAEQRRLQEAREHLDTLPVTMPAHTPGHGSPSRTTFSQTESVSARSPAPTTHQGDLTDAAHTSPSQTLPVLPPHPDTASVTSHSTGHGIGPSQISSLRELFREERDAWFSEHRQSIEDQKREREAYDAERIRQAEEREERIRALEEELAGVKEELRLEKEARQADNREREEQEAQQHADREDMVLAQLTDITNLIQGQQQGHEVNKELLEGIKAQSEESYMRLETHTIETRDRLDTVEGMLGENKDLAEADTQQIIDELKRQRDELIEVMRQLFDQQNADIQRQHADTLEAVKHMAQEQVPFNVQGYLDEFSRALASEVRMLLGEVGKLREERRGLQHEISFLLGVKSKYVPGGEFESEWKGPMGAPGMPPTGPPPDAGPPPPPPDIPMARPAWRTVSTRTSKKKKRDAVPPPPAPVAQPDPRQQVRSWATWQPDPNLAPSPSSYEHPTLAAPAESPGLFGPRSPRSSRHLG